MCSVFRVMFVSAGLDGGADIIGHRKLGRDRLAVKVAASCFSDRQSSDPAHREIRTSGRQVDASF